MRFAIASWVVPIAISTTCSCANPEPTRAFDAAELRRAFPDQARRILDGDRSLSRVASGFEATRVEGLAVTLPDRAERPIAVRAGPLRFLVHETNARGAGTIEGAALVYPRGAGDAIWAPLADGLEEWIHVPPGGAADGDVLASWEIEGADVREVPGLIEIADARGATRVRVRAPEAVTASGRRLAPSLHARGHLIELSLDGANGEDVLVDPSWSSAATMLHPRWEHTATALVDGRVLVTGGRDSSSSTTALASAEIFDPVAGTWTAAANMAHARRLHAAVRLGDGRVLVISGSSDTSPITETEIYDPAMNKWSDAAPVHDARTSFAAAYIAVRNEVVIVGGADPSDLPMSSSEIYNPAMDAWSGAGNQLSYPTIGPSIVALPNGAIIAGGVVQSGSGSSSVESFDPISKNWNDEHVLPYATGNASAVLSGGSMFVLGGDSSAGMEQQNGAVGSGSPIMWVSLSSVPYPFAYAAAVTLPNDKVLVTGGIGPAALSTGFLIDTGDTPDTFDLLAPRAYHTATLMPGGAVLIAGGNDGDTILDTAEVYSDLGATCMGGSDCIGGNCAGGVCCDSPCAEECRTCSASHAKGHCEPANDGTACKDGGMCVSGACRQPTGAGGASPSASASTSSAMANGGAGVGGAGGHGDQPTVNLACSVVTPAGSDPSTPLFATVAVAGALAARRRRVLRRAPRAWRA